MNSYGKKNIGVFRSFHPRGRDGVGAAPPHGRTRAANGVPLRDGRWGERVHHARGGRCRGLWRGDGDKPQLLLHGRATGVPPPKHPGSPRSSTRLLSPSTRLVRHRPSSRGVAAHSTCTGPAGIRMCHLTVTSVVHLASTHPDCRPALHIDPACEHTSRRRRLRRWPPRLPWRATCNCTRSWRSAARGQRRKAPTGRAC